MLFLIAPILKPVVGGGIKEIVKVGIGGLVPQIISGIGGAIIGELLFPESVAIGTLPPEIENGAKKPENDLTQIGGGNFNPGGPDFSVATPGKKYQLTGYVDYVNHWQGCGIQKVNFTTIGNTYKVIAPFSGSPAKQEFDDPWGGEANNCDKSNMPYVNWFITHNGGEIKGLTSKRLDNPDFKAVITGAYPLDGGEDIPIIEPGFNPTPNPKPDIDDDFNPEIKPSIDPEIKPEIKPITKPNPDPDPDKNPFPILVPYPVPYPVPQPYPVPEIITVPTPPKIITIPQPYPVPGPTQLVPYPVPIDLEKPKPSKPTPVPPVPPTQCNPCCECDKIDSSDILSLLDEILDFLSNDEIDWSEIKEHIDEKLKCHEPSFKAIISNQKIDRMSILSTMSYSIHNALMLSFDVDSSNQYSLLAPSTQSSTAFKEYCGEEGNIDYGSFVNEINSSIANIQSSIDYSNNNDDTFVNNSIIITTASSIWKAVVSGFQSIRDYCSILIKQISSIGNSLKYSKVVNDDDYEYMSDNADGLTPEQKGYDIGLVPGNSQSTILNSIANVTNPLSDVDLWEEIENNKQSLKDNAETDKTTILDKISNIKTDLDNNDYPDFLMPEIIE